MKKEFYMLVRRGHRGGVITDKPRFFQFVQDTFTQREKLQEFRFRVTPILSESKKQRGFFEGGLCTLFAYHHDQLDHREWRDVKKAREWLKAEFHSDWLVFLGKSQKVSISTKNELHRVCPDIIEWFIEEGMAGIDNIAVDTKKYRLWKDTVFPYGGPDNWCDYLESINKLRRIDYQNYNKPLTPVKKEHD